MTFRLAISQMLLLVSAAAFADSGEAELGKKLDLSGSLRGGYFSSSRKLDGKEDVGVGSLWLKSLFSFSNNISLVVDGWARNDDSFSGNSNHGKLREGYVNFNAGDTDFRIGKQIITWGRADQINPTNNVTPRNYTLLTAEDDDQRFGTLAAKVTYHLRGTSLTGIWLPDFNPNRVPLAALPGVYFTERVPRAGQGAIKFDRSGGAVDWSVSYFNGLDINPDLKIGTAGSSGLNLILTHNRIRVLGMDAATVVGRYGLRTEAAYVWTSNTGSNDPLLKKSFLYLVAGGDRTFFDNLNVNLQYYFRQVSHYQDPQNIADPLLRTVAIQGAVVSNQLDHFQHGVSIRVADKWLHETLEGEIAGVFSLTRSEYVLKPKLVYAFDDKLKGTLGVDIYRGNNNTFFGQLRANSLVFAEIKYSF